MTTRRPVPEEAARRRLAVLESEMYAVDRVLRENWTAEVDQHRDRLQREYDRLGAVLATLERNRRGDVRPCVTGKIAHADERRAAAHLASMLLIRDEPDPRAHLLSTYLCRTCWHWHVGHQREGA